MVRAETGASLDRSQASASQKTMAGLGPKQRLRQRHKLFGESAKHGREVEIGSPHFVDFGRNMEYSPDGPLMGRPT
jgi:hypothetical protein